jgi:D-glucosaminate PTS system EIIB component
VIAISDWALVRIDDRLIHGQVIAVWVRQQKFTRIIIIDDKVAADSFMQDVLKLSAPPNLQVDVVSVDTALSTLSAATPNRETTMVLMKSPDTAKRLFDGGLYTAALNIGGIGSGPGRKNVYRNTALSDAEFNTLKYLHEKGVKITFLTVPGEKPKAFSEMVK